MPTQTPPATPQPQLALIGAGYWGKNLARNFLTLGVLHTLADAAQTTLDNYGSEYSGVRKTTNFPDILNDPEITCVAIAAPAVHHYELAKQCLAAGKDVYIEKPICLNVRDAEELGALAAEQRRILMVGHLLQYHPCVQRLLEMVRQGELGKLHYITSNRLNLGKIRKEENALWSFAPHDISVILALADNQLPEQVACTGESYLTPGVADTTLTTLKFAGSLRAHVYVSWLNPFKEQKLTVVGSAGMAVFDDTKDWPDKLVIYRNYLTWANGQTPMPNKAAPEPVLVPQAEPLRAECQHFLDCCHTRQTPRTDSQEGIRVLRVLARAQQSLDAQNHTVGTNPMGQNETAKAYFAHPTAVIDAGASIGCGTKLWHFSHVMKGAQIGERCVFGQNVNVDGGVVIGNNVKVQNNVSIYTGLTIEDDVFLGPSCVLTNVTNPRSQVNRHSLYERTTIKRGATVGANATVVCGVTIGRYAFIGAGAVVTKDVPDYALILGNPGRQRGWMSRHGQALKHPDAAGIMVCPETGFRYQLDPDRTSLRCLDHDENAALPEQFAKGTKTYDQFKLIPKTA